MMSLRIFKVGALMNGASGEITEPLRSRTPGAPAGEKTATLESPSTPAPHGRHGLGFRVLGLGFGI